MMHNEFNENTTYKTLVLAFLRWKLKLEFIFCWCHNRYSIYTRYWKCIEDHVCVNAIQAHNASKWMKKWSSKQNASTTARRCKNRRNLFFSGRIRILTKLSTFVRLYSTHAFMLSHSLSLSSMGNPLQTIEYSYKCRISSWAQVFPSPSLCMCARANVWCVSSNVTWTSRTFSINNWSHPCEVWFLLVFDRFRRSKKQSKFFRFLRLYNFTIGYVQLILVCISISIDTFVLCFKLIFPPQKSTEKEE